MGLTDKRVNYKPFEYPEVLKFIDLINKSYWVHSEVDFTADIQDFHSELSEVEKEVIKRSLLGIAQIEVGVKTFWGDLYKMFPKPELNGLGSTFAESEWRHSEAYSRLLEVLGYNDEFKDVINVPVMKNKIEVIENMLDSTLSFNVLLGTKRYNLLKLVLFTIIIENTSLFSQFANILSFTKFKGYMKNVSNIIAWTSIDEKCHSDAGIYLINKYKEEVDLSDDLKEHIRGMIEIYMLAEDSMLDWIYEKGEVSFFTKEDMSNFMKYRLDEALKQIDIKPLYNITDSQYKPMKWFDEEVFANELDDFFAKRPTAYTKHDKPITKDSLF